MVGYVIVAKHVNALAEGGFDYSIPMSDVFLNPLDADYVISGIAAVDQVQFISKEVTFP